MSKSAATKAELARAGTMDITAKEGEAYLDKNLTTWKKADLMNHFDDGKDSEESSKLAKCTTMVGTAEEGKALLGGEVLGDTRQETNRKKKQTLAKTSPKAKANAGAAKRTSTINKAVEEAKAVYDDLDTAGEGRSMRKRASPPKKASPVKRAGTMVKTAKEGKEFVKRGNKKASSKKKSKKEVSDDDDSADD